MRLWLVSNIYKTQDWHKFTDFTMNCQVNRILFSPSAQDSGYFMIKTSGDVLKRILLSCMPLHTLWRLRQNSQESHILGKNIVLCSLIELTIPHEGRIHEKVNFSYHKDKTKLKRRKLCSLSGWLHKEARFLVYTLRC